MRISTFLVSAFVLFFVLIQTGCNSEKSLNSNIVATYDNGYVVLSEELHSYVKDWLYYKKFSDIKDAYNNALNDLLINQFKRMDFFEKGYDKDTILINNIIRVINEELVAEYFETQYLQKNINDNEVKNIYKIMDKEVNYRAIYLNKPIDASQKQLDSLKEKALEIKSEIEKGADFSLFVQKYSQNEISLANNGYMPTADWRLTLLNPIGKVLFNLNKNDIKVLDTYDAFVIIKVTDITKIKVEPFELVKNKIEDELKRGFADASLDQYEKDKKEIVNVESFKWNKVGLNQIKKWFIEPNFLKGEYKNIISNEIGNGNNEIILTYDKGIIDYKKLLNLMEEILIIEDTENLDEDAIKKYLVEALRTELIVKKANSLNLKKNIFNAFTTNPTLKNQIALLYNQVEIEDKIPTPTDEDLKQYFKENETTLYYQLEKINLFAMVFPTEKAAKEASEKIKNGIQFEKVTGNYFVYTYVKKRNGEITTYLNQKAPSFGEIAFKMKKSEVAGPIKFDDNNQEKFAVVKCYHIRPAKQLTYDEAKEKVFEDYMQFHREKLQKEVEEKLKEKYHYEINEEVLNNLISIK